MVAEQKDPLRVVTYNIHRCRGMDGYTKPERIANVLKRLRPDVVALQEVVGRGHRGSGQEEEIAARLNMSPVLAPARTFRGHLYGNAVLSRLPMENHAVCDLTEEGHEPRLCQRIDILVQGRPVHFYNVHLGTSASERKEQARKLAEFIAEPDTGGPKVLLGDFNEWKKGVVTRLLSERFKSLDLVPFLRWRRTYPGIIPLMHLDHIYYEGPVSITDIQVSRRFAFLMASDHLPILAEMCVFGEEQEEYRRG
jgi:endonuclease/exonuclease/phosphatase family metal-dependent hydrolase